MRKLQLFLLLFLLSLTIAAQTSTLEKFLRTQPEIKSVGKIKENPFFSEAFKIMVRQPLDHSDTTKGFFLQRVFISDKGKENPVLLITEGYYGDYASGPNYLNELCPILHSNQIFVEHRYFGQSCPDTLNWKYLTVENAAADHHKIVEIFKKYYTKSWINTGISKGGQTAVYHRALYPNDVEVTVAYVAPLNFSVEDKRHGKFLASVPGTKDERGKIKAFQLQILKNRDLLVPKLIQLSKDKNYHYRIPVDEVLDYCVLEYPFAFWQWGKPVEEIPAANATPDELFSYLIKISDPSYFAVEGIEKIQPFFIQAQRELGYYAYNTRPLKKYLHIKNGRHYLEKIFIPENVHIKYHKRTARNVKQFIRHTNKKMIFIYGEFDPWSASAFDLPNTNNFLKVIKPGGCHKTRINNMSDNQKNKIINTLNHWIK